MGTGRMICEYNESKMLDNEVKYRVENWKDFDYEKQPDEDEVRGKMYDDSFLFEQYSEDVCNGLTEILHRKNKAGYWRAEVSNFGWQGKSGSAVFEITNGAELIQQVLPKTDCTFKVYNYGKGIAIQNWHHDSPMGNEWYYLVPITHDAYYKAKGE